MQTVSLLYKIRPSSGLLPEHVSVTSWYSVKAA